MSSHLSSHNKNNISPSGLIKQKKSKINVLKTTNLIPVKQNNNVIALHSSIAAQLNTDFAPQTTNTNTSATSINTYTNNTTTTNNNNNSLVTTSTPLVHLTSNDFKSKKISSILKSNLVSSQFSTPKVNSANFENISNNSTINVNYNNGYKI
jgi:hypothetical protein